MAVPSGFCQAEITFICLNSDTTIQIFIGLTPITNPFPVTTTDTQLTLQAVITANTTGVGVIITIQNDSVFPLTCPLGGQQGTLHLLVQVASTTQITDSLIVTDSNEGFGSITPTAFTCNLTPPTTKKKKRVMGSLGRCPDEIIFRAEVRHPQVKYCNNTIYNFYGADEQGLLHYIKSNSNISYRNTGNWLVKNI